MHVNSRNVHNSTGPFMADANRHDCTASSGDVPDTDRASFVAGHGVLEAHTARARATDKIPNSTLSRQRLPGHLHGDGPRCRTKTLRCSNLAIIVPLCHINACPHCQIVRRKRFCFGCTVFVLEQQSCEHWYSCYLLSDVQSSC
jgi:hypothetical protein